MACSQSIVKISDVCSASKGGIVEAYITEYQDGIFSVSRNADADDIPDKVTGVSSSATFHQFAFRKNTGNFTSTLNVDDANGVRYVSTDITLKFTKMETAKRLGIATLALGEVAMIVKDANGLYWAFGVDASVTATAGTAQTGTASTDGNYYEITLQSNDDSFPLELSKEVFDSITKD